MMRNYPFFTNMGVPSMPLWFGLSPVSAGMFGLPVGLLTIIIVSYLTSPPSKELQEMVEHVRKQQAQRSRKRRPRGAETTVEDTDDPLERV